MAARADIRAIESLTINSYRSDTGHFPTRFQDLVEKPGDAANWQGPYFDPPQIPMDPWGNSYIYEYPGKRSTNAYDLISAGPDGKLGTKDDIGNWTTK
jgi:general secretion pathway protein G